MTDGAPRNNVRALRRGLGMTQQELADAAGLGQVQVHRIETGAQQGSARARRAIAAALECPELLVFPAVLLSEDQMTKPGETKTNAVTR